MFQDENKKTEKKETPGPPLQTASVNVRALIEEKIIQKRTTGRSTLLFGLGKYRPVHKPIGRISRPIVLRRVSHPHVSYRSCV